MMTPIVAIGTLAILFVVFGLLKQRADCGGNCAGCSRECEFTKDGSHD